MFGSLSYEHNYFRHVLKIHLQGNAQSKRSHVGVDHERKPWAGTLCGILPGFSLFHSMIKRVVRFG